MPDTCPTCGAGRTTSIGFADPMSHTPRVFVDMFGAGSALFARVPLRRTAITAIRNGFAVLPVEPGKTEPICPLIGRERREPHPCGPHHAITDEAVAERVFRRLEKLDGPRPNLAIVPGPSRLVAVVFDDADGFMAFKQDMADFMRWPWWLTVPRPMCLSPIDGGFHLFGLPAGVFLDWNTVDTLHGGGYRVEWGLSTLLVPPSVLPEGPIEIGGGDILRVPDWLFDAIRQHIAAAEKTTRT